VSEKTKSRRGDAVISLLSLGFPVVGAGDTTFVVGAVGGFPVVATAAFVVAFCVVATAGFVDAVGGFPDVATAAFVVAFCVVATVAFVVAFVGAASSAYTAAQSKTTKATLFHIFILFFVFCKLNS